MKITIACAQIQVEPGNPEANTKKALAYLEKARAQQADIVLFPELTIPGYLLGDLWEQNAFLRDCEAWGKELIAASKTEEEIREYIKADSLHYISMEGLRSSLSVLNPDDMCYACFNAKYPDGADKEMELGSKFQFETSC